jgi:parallel beta-helix repeat protein
MPAFSGSAAPTTRNLQNFAESVYCSRLPITLNSRTDMRVNMAHIHSWAVLCTLFLVSAGGSASAATVCVNARPKPDCYPTIKAGIAAAQPGDTVQVAQGTYREQVIINKALSLIGANTANTLIDASGNNTNSGGNGVGIYVDGMDNLTAAEKLVGGTGLSEVVVQGFTVANAQFEGILVTNASNITIVENHVTGSNRGLQVPTSPGGCPFIPPWETSEGFDCGEGLHLAGVHHSTVANNVVDHNAGGILLTDETGPNHDNLITGNLVTENGYDCGITLASHRPPTNLGFGQTPPSRSEFFAIPSPIMSPRITAFSSRATAPGSAFSRRRARRHSRPYKQPPTITSS